MTAADLAEIPRNKSSLPPIYSGPHRRPGRPKGALNKATIEMRDFILDQLVPVYPRMTVRQIFYKVEVAALVAKTEGGYKRVQNQVLNMRREGVLPWDFISDATRWQRKPSTWDTAEDAIKSMARSYRRNLWQSQGVRIEVWLEKDALAGVIVDITAEWDVALMVSRGQSSVTFLYNAAQAAREAYDKHGVTTYVYTLYDHDPAGVLRSAPAIARDLPKFAPDVPIVVETLAVTPLQITYWNLPTRPGKAKDPQADAWGNRPNVELDAIDPNDLTQLVEDAITSHVNPNQWEIEQTIEEQERQGLLRLVEKYELLDG